jgi:LysM repeat protein
MVLAMFATLLGACATSDNTASPAEAWKSSTSSIVTSTTSTVPTTTTVTFGPSRTYRVRVGDTLTTIARRRHVTPDAIARLNNLANADRIHPGETLKIPAALPVELAVDPPSGPQGAAFQFRLTGATPGDRIRFRVRSPTSVFTGRAHDVTSSGAVTATYQTGSDEKSGRFRVTATGSSGTVAHASFEVVRNPNPP